MAATQYFEQVQKIFIAFYQRPADPAGLKYWAQRVDAAGGDFGAVIDAFAASPEAVALYGAIDATTIGTVIDKLYLALFNTAPDAAGKKFYVDGFIAGTFSAGTIALNVLNGATGDDAVAVTNKVQVANNFTQQVDGRPLTDAYFGSGTSFNVTYAGDTDAQAARDILKGVTFNASTVLNPSQVTEQLKAKIADATDPIIGQSGGQTFTLTEAVQDLVGTAGNDTFIAGVTGGGAGGVTLTAGDKITGGAGTDTLMLYGANAANFATANVTGVEVVKAQATFDASTNADVKEAWLFAGTPTLQTVTLTKTQVGGLEGLIGAAGAGAATFAFTSVAGLADTATLALSGATATGGVTVAGIESLTLNATGKNSIGNLTAAATDTLTVTGAGSLTAVAAAGGTFKVVDASTNTGGVTLDISAAAANDIKVTGGAGNDEITVDYLNLSKLDTINLGAGTDTLGFNTTAVVFNDAATVGRLAGVTGVEGLKVNGAVALTADAALLSQSNFIINSTGKAALTNLANTDTVTYSAATNVGNTIGLELGQNTLNLTLAGGKAAASGTTEVTGSSVVNITSTGTAGVAANTLTLTTADNNSFKVTGSQDLTLSVAGKGGVTGQTVDGTAFTGKLGVTGSGQTDIIIGGSGADTITGGAGADKLTGGAGADTFSFVGTAGATQSGATFGLFDTITDFVVGTDKLQFTGVTDVVSGQQAAVQAAVTALAAGATAAQIATAMATANTTALGVSFATYGGDTYVLFETAAGAPAVGVATDDVFIKLAGVTTAPTFAADVIA